MEQVYFCADEGGVEDDTCGGCMVWAQTMLARQIVIKVDNVKILVLKIELD